MSSRFGRNKKRKLIAKHESEIVFMDRENTGLRRQLLVASDSVKHLQIALNHLMPKPIVTSYKPEKFAADYTTICIELKPLRMEVVGELHPKKIEAYAREFADKVYEDVHGKLREAMNRTTRGIFKA